MTMPANCRDLILQGLAQAGAGFPSRGSRWCTRPSTKLATGSAVAQDGDSTILMRASRETMVRPSRDKQSIPRYLIAAHSYCAAASREFFLISPAIQFMTVARGRSCTRADFRQKR